MELSTVEVRWFQEGQCPAGVAEWFHGGRWVGEPERRTDEYLRLPDREDLGVKRRAGVQLDLKVRTGTRDGAGLPEGMEGPVEAWTKWSFPLGPAASLPGGESWIPVDKLRWSRLHAATEAGGAKAVPVDTEVQSGCAAELVELAIGGLPAWGFGFEAFGEGNLVEVLGATCRAVVADTPLDDITFTAGGPHSYPAWLVKRYAAFVERGEWAVEE